MFTAPIPVNEDERLKVLQQYQILDTPSEQGYDDVTMLASFICDTPYATITLVDQDRQWFKSEVGFGRSETARDGGFCACALLQPDTMIVEDALLDQRFRENPFVVDGPQIRFYAGAPLISPGGYILGTVCVFDSRPRVLKPEQIEALEALARQVMARFELRLKLIEQERNATALRTVEKLAAVGRLASSMAHEINNPLQSMTNLLYMAQMDDAAEQRASYVMQAQEELKRVSHIVTQTLRFHSQSDGPVPTRLAELVESTRMLFRVRIAHASATMIVEDRQSALLLCYSSDVRQVLANLIGNALDAVSATRGATITVRVRDGSEWSTGRPGVRLTIADNGSGIDATTQHRLFEPFFSTKGARGAGLGLWVSKGILDKHDAHLQLRSSQDAVRCGTVFVIFFPLKAERR